MAVTDTALITPEQASCVKDAVAGTLSTMCGVELSYQGDGAETDTVTGIVGIVSLVGDVAWSTMLGLPPEMATAIALSFAGFEIEYDSEDMTDLVGELANVLCGDIAARLDRLGVKANLSLPTVARGDGLSVCQPDASPALHMRFAAPHGYLWLALAVGAPG